MLQLLLPLRHKLLLHITHELLPWKSWQWALVASGNVLGDLAHQPVSRGDIPRLLGLVILDLNRVLSVALTSWDGVANEQKIVPLGFH